MHGPNPSPGGGLKSRRPGRPWYRHATLSMLALAFLQVTAAHRAHQQLRTTFPESARHDHNSEQISLSASETRCVIGSLTLPQHDGSQNQRWPRWRRKHQADSTSSPIRMTFRSGVNHSASSVSPPWASTSCRNTNPPGYGSAEPRKKQATACGSPRAGASKSARVAAAADGQSRPAPPPSPIVSRPPAAPARGHQHASSRRQPS